MGSQIVASSNKPSDAIVPVGVAPVVAQEQQSLIQVEVAYQANNNAKLSILEELARKIEEHMAEVTQKKKLLGTMRSEHQTKKGTLQNTFKKLEGEKKELLQAKTSLLQKHEQLLKLN